MQSRSLTIHVTPEVAVAYETASPEEQRKLDELLSRKLREAMKRTKAHVRTAPAQTARGRAESEIHPEVLSISGLVPPAVDARTEYREYLLKKHQ